MERDKEPVAESTVRKGSSEKASRLRNNKASFAMHWETFWKWLNRRLLLRSFPRSIGSSSEE